MKESNDGLDDFKKAESELDMSITVTNNIIDRMRQEIKELNKQVNAKTNLNQFQVYHSDELHELFGAMAKAQGDMQNAIANQENPFFKSKYPDLATVIDVYRKPLANHGLTFMQWSLAGGKMLNWLGHSSGQFIANVEELRIKDQNNPQAHGSSYSYLRRYTALGVMGLGKGTKELTDDDGSEGSKEPPQNVPKRSKGRPPKKGRTDSPVSTFTEGLKDVEKVDLGKPKELDEGQVNMLLTEAKQKLNEADNLPHLDNIWNKHNKEWRAQVGKEIFQLQVHHDELKQEMKEKLDEKQKEFS